MDPAPLSASFWTQLKATVIRNLIRKKRNKKHTLQELFVPVCYLSVIIILSVTLKPQTQEAILDPTGHNFFISQDPFNFLNRSDISVAPNNADTKKFINENVMPLVHQHKLSLAFHYYESEADMEKQYLNDSSSIFIGLVLDDLGSSLQYKIRVSSDFAVTKWKIPDLSDKLGDQAQCRSNQTASGLEMPWTCQTNVYFWSGFATLQALVDNAWLKKSSGSHNPPSLTLQLLPKSSHTSDMETVMRSIVPIYLIISFSPFLGAMCQFVVEEKEKKIKESMKMVGLRDSVFWLSWFLVYSILILAFSIICSLLVNFVTFGVTMSYYFIVLILMLELGFSMIVFAFMMTSLFSKAKTAGIAGSMGMMLFSCLYYLQVFLEDSPTQVFWFLGLLSPTAFAMSMDKILHFDIHNIPLSESILWDTSSSGLPIAGAMIMIAVDIVIYGLLAMWLDNVMPTEYGTRLKPWFFLTSAYWTGVTKQKVGVSPFSIPVNDDPDIEQVPGELIGNEAVIINQIHKTFTGVGKKKVHAVQGVSLNIYPGEITALLGHNGAGKSTLFNILTGMTAPSKGNAHIFGYNVSNPNEMVEIRKMIGICPQHDVLFDELTPREHLRFFARIRGVPEPLIAQEVENIITDVDLREKADALASKLSGGQKRKLSVGIALIGDPKVIFLDEPTAGVDPYSRRHLWAVLKKRKEGKVILLTTHFMDEADILADRKAIMSKGKIRCYGSSLFLKNRFGLGYHLTTVLSPKNDPEGIGELIENNVPGAEKARQFGRELSYILPREKLQHFPKLFAEIEREIKHDSLGISSYGVSMTTLEEVFLQLGEQEESNDTENNKPDIVKSSIVKRQSSIGSKTFSAPENQQPNSSEGYNFESVATEKSSWQIYKSLIYLRVRRLLREPGAIIWQMLMPVVFVCIGMFLNSQQAGVPSASQDVGFQISPDIYHGMFKPAKFGFQNNTGGPLDGIGDLLNSTGNSLDDVTGMEFADLVDLYHMAVINFKESHGELVGWYNDSAKHAIPVLINTINNAAAHQINKGNINLTNHPFPLTTMSTGFQGLSFGGAMLVGMAYVFIPMGFSFALIEDREIRAKNQLRVNGLSFFLYFGTFFTLLGSMMLMMLIILLVMVVAFDMAELMVPAAFGLFSSMYFLITFPSLLFVGCFSYLFDKIESAQNFMPLSMYMGLIPYIAVVMTDMFGKVAIARTLHIVCAFIIPIYIPYGIIYYISKQYLICSFTQTCEDLSISDYWIPEVYCLYIAILVHIIFWGTVLKIVDILKDGGNWRDAIPFSKSKATINNQNNDVIEGEDEDVMAERTSVAEYMSNRSTPSTLPVIAVHNLRKEYKSGVNQKKTKKKKKSSTKVAVRNMSMSIAPGEVFGLLGHNGAGKTTTMRIIIAEEAASNGRVRIGKDDIVSNQSEAFDQLGYCPQFDALWKKNTVREHLEVYASIRGVPPGEIGPLVTRYMAGLRITEHADKYAEDCSGGTKRKLSYAMSMLGNPRIVLLDEPSTGMDPQSKRFVWDTILASFKQDRGAILTTHSMEEADALCTRVGIMVKGALRCLGSTQHLKNKYGAGYILEVKVRVSVDWESLESHILAIFPGAKVAESFADRRTYSIAQHLVVSLADAFRQLEICREKYSVEDYSFSQTTLEQVFIEFAKQQEDEKEHQKYGSIQLTSL